MSFNPEGPVGLKLKTNLVNEIKSRFNTAQDDAVDIAEYIAVLIASNKQPQEIASEVNELVEMTVDVDFINSVFSEIDRLTREHEQAGSAQQASAAPTATVATPLQASTVPAAPANSFSSTAQTVVPNYQNNRGSRDFNARGGRGGGIAHNTNGRNDRFKKTSQFQNNKLERALESTQNPGITNVVSGSTFVPKPPKGRCPDFPFCSNKECDKAHPTRNCFSYPNCPNPPGTCNYLHPDQDQELIAKLEESKKLYADKKKNELMLQQATCRFGNKCTKDTCPYAHPSPANSDAKITTLEWCSSGKTCTDASCTKAHPPPLTALPVKEASGEIALEQCKFGSQCTNYKCPRRHATSHVPCREGANCKRYDCVFAHPFNEVCRFNEKCSNKFCMYQHPNGRSIASNTWTQEGGSAPTNARAFAVPDDQVMEQAVQD
ncbi:polyadenylated RNA binding protein [Scheffersomyces stipitis CBS 6054]|uniref:Polyadenylated RNA binding protein n=1 Tax=Scheffersomyces stipitis (strain ATCC 58785 / CBS 6054 / NBRC 10063 / NRRL Y-11545) TaxID=322104 RepID=A3GFH6_PICST|nr:polyadenylated RNA binding protein [Scheffersomyces stipitis CBS 6054]EAZ63759.2 polyadenylated RNA binding protein [Scheffersomyces stipitis CBS 6054]